MTISKITEAVNRSRKVIYNLLNDTKNYEKRVVGQQLCLIMINEPFYMLLQILAARQKNCLQNWG